MKLKKASRTVLVIGRILNLFFAIITLTFCATLAAVMEIEESQTLEYSIETMEPMSQDMFSQDEKDDTIVPESKRIATEPQVKDEESKEPGSTENSVLTVIEELGYTFNTDEQLRNIKTGKPYEFNIKEGDRKYNQKQYDALGEVITQYIYELLERKEYLTKVTIPVGATPSAGKSFIFVSKDWKESKKLLLLIHGSGGVRAGQWSRKLIINDSLKSGTQIPYIRKGKEEGYAVVVLNPNQSTDIFNRQIPVEGSRTPEEHLLYVWDKFVMNSKSEHVAIVAHSYGGAITLNALKERRSVMKKVFAVAFTDSVHQLSYQLKGAERSRISPWLQQHCRNWVCSPTPLDKELRAYHKDDCPIVSAGTLEHTRTSSMAMNSVFAFLNEMYKKLSTKEAHADKSSARTEL